MPRAAGLAEKLLHDFGPFLAGGVTLAPGERGSFEVTFNGELIFSKRLSERFPESMEVEGIVERKVAMLDDSGGDESGDPEVVAL